MIKIENVDVTGWEHAIRGMRNPMNSWEKSDSVFGSLGCDDVHNISGDTIGFGPISGDADGFVVGPNDRDLMMRLAKAGSVDAKFRRMIIVYVDITAPLYWWKEFDTYKVGTVANSCSTMHKIHDKEFTMDDFSYEHLLGFTYNDTDAGIPYVDVSPFQDKSALKSPLGTLAQTIILLNECRNKFLETKDKVYWWQMIQLLPSSYNQKRTVMLNYEVLSNMYKHRRTHKLDEWQNLCFWIEGLPYSEIITCSEERS